MKKFTFLTISLLLCFGVFGQTLDVVPMDSKVKYGKLENGLTYYIRSNKTPENRAEFYIAQNVGSMQEEDSQAGLAHFLEHMAFNGTTNFPEKTMLNYLETNGVKFGTNVNAYTSLEETVYNLSDIPLTNEGLVDSCLLVLYDWSCGIALKDKEIDSERGVIREEWRTRGGSGYRIMEQMLLGMYKDSKYANRLPIGSIDVINNFKYQEIKDYYKKWYRPDLQAIIIVGDFDADKMENKVKTLFSKIPKAVNPAKIEKHDIPDNKEPVVVKATDVEATSTRLTIYYKHNILPEVVKQSTQGYTISIAHNIISAMLNERLITIANKPESPFTSVGAYYGNYFVAKTKDAFTAVAICKENEILSSAKTLQIELERAKKFGFTEPELERAKANMLKHFENSYNNRDKQRNSSYVGEYVRHFTSGELSPGIEYEYNLYQMLAPSITLAAINQVFKAMVIEDNMVVTLSGPEKEGLEYPSDKEIIKAIEDARSEKIEAYKEEVIDTNLVPNMPKSGSIVKKEKDKTFEDVSVWTLSNGVKVLLKPTKFKDDQILMTSLGVGGTSIFGDKDVTNISYVNSVYSVGGTGNFSTLNLRKALAGKVAYVSPYISGFTQGVSGSSSIKDFETLMQLTYLALEGPRKDEEVYGSYIERLKNNLKNKEAEPETAFSDSINHALYGNNIYTTPFKYKDIEKLDYNRMLEMYKEAFSNNASLTFVFVGNIDEEKMEPYIKTYLGSLVAGKEIKKGDYRTHYKKGNVNNIFAKIMKNPKASVRNTYTGSLERNQVNMVAMSYLSQILDIVYTEEIREKEGGTYGVSVGGNITRESNEARLQISFDTDPERYVDLNKKIIDIAKDIADNGPRDEDFIKVKEYLLKDRQESIRENGYWQSILSTHAFYNEDMHSNYENILNSISKSDIQKLAKIIVDNFDLKTVIMNPEYVK